MIEALGNLGLWIFWAYYATGTIVMGAMLVVHLRVTHTADVAPWLVVGAAFCGAIGSIIGGIQAGSSPIATAAHGVALVRAFWVVGITLGMVASGMYLWSIRKKE